MTNALALTWAGAGPHEEAAAEPLSMTEAEFQAFYARTAQPLRAFVAHMMGTPALADDIAQEAFVRMLRASLPEMTESQRKNYLYRVATNLVRDHYRSPARRTSEVPVNLAAQGDDAGAALLRADLESVLAELGEEQRSIVWMAYVEGASHREIAEVTGRKAQSIRPLLFRARQRLAEKLRARGFAPVTP